MDAVGTQRRGRGSRKKARLTTKVEMLPNLVRGLPLTEPMDEEQINKINDASMSILEEVGVVFRDPIALKQWETQGAKVVDDRVYFDRAMIMDLISTIPSDITLEARNPEHTVKLGGKNSIFVPMTGA
ncbi:MAG: trimethylamine methyltransferase family protein, partial [Thiolinea sp.]